MAASIVHLAMSVSLRTPNPNRLAPSIERPTMALQGSLHKSLGCVRLPRSHRTLRIQRSLVVHAGQNYKIAVLPGDGIGPEITKVALKALEAAGRKADVSFTFNEALIGGAAIDATGKPLPEETLEQCKASDAVLLAAIGGWVPARPRAPAELPLRCRAFARGAESCWASAHPAQYRRMPSCTTGISYQPAAIATTARCSSQVQMGHTASGTAAGAGAAGPACRPQRVRQPAAGDGAAAAGRRVHAQARGVAEFPEHSLESRWPSFTCRALSASLGGDDQWP